MAVELKDLSWVDVNWPSSVVVNEDACVVVRAEIWLLVRAPSRVGSSEDICVSLRLEIAVTDIAET